MTTTSKRLPFKFTGKSSLIRPSFSPGLLLQDDDLTQVVDYARDMTRLLFRSMLGCGVLCGFEVKGAIDECGNLKIDIDQGVALDCRGDILELPAKQAIEIDPECCTELPSPIWVVIGHQNQPCAPRDVTCSPQENESGSTYTRIREGYEIRVLASAPDGACGCKGGASDENGSDPCYESHYKGVCACSCDCDAVVLAKISFENNADGNPVVTVDHSARRFIRPQLIKDPLVNRASSADTSTTTTDTNGSGKPPITEKPTQDKPTQAPAVEAQADTETRTKPITDEAAAPATDEVTAPAAKPSATPRTTTKNPKIVKGDVIDSKVNPEVIQPSDEIIQPADGGTVGKVDAGSISPKITDSKVIATEKDTAPILEINEKLDGVVARPALKG